MNTGLRTSLSACLYLATAVAALLLVPHESGAQGSNTAYGANALQDNTTGYDNTALGFEALFSNTTGHDNTATGTTALTRNTTGFDNTATGPATLCFNTTGSYNTASGVEALFSNTTGNENTANGIVALFSNTTGSENVANGSYALYSNTTGYDNTAAGASALYWNNRGYNNTATGIAALGWNTTGFGNIALGNYAGKNITTGSNDIAIGSAGANETGVIRIGTAGTHNAAYIAGIHGVTASGGVSVFVNSNGQLGTLTSSRRFKNDIKDMGSVSEKLMQLRPVTFRYKDSAETGVHHLQYGLIAEEVAKVYPDLVQYDKAGKPFTVYYHLLTPMVLNELQKERRQCEAQKTEITALKAAHTAEIAALKSELASLQAAQEHQGQVLAKLTAYVQVAPNHRLLRNTVLAQR